MSSTSENVERTVAALSREGLPVNMIAQQCGVHPSTVVRIRRRTNVAGRRPRRLLTEAEQRTALAMLVEGASYKEVGRTLGRHPANLARRFPGHAWPPQQCGQFTGIAQREKALSTNAIRRKADQR